MNPHMEFATASGREDDSELVKVSLHPQSVMPWAQLTPGYIEAVKICKVHTGDKVEPHLLFY